MKKMIFAMMIGVLAVGCAVHESVNPSDRSDSVTTTDSATMDTTTYSDSEIPASESVDRTAMPMTGSRVSSMDDSRTFRNRDVVEKVQTELNDRGYSAGREDGIIGPNTKRALSRFQRHEGISSNGIIDMETLRALELEDLADRAEALSE